MGINPNLTSENVPGIQQKNIAWLKAQTDYTKAQNEFVKEVNKSKPETWQAMTESTKEMISFGNSGGFNLIFGGALSRLKTQIENEFEGALVPLTNAISGLINELIGENGLADAAVGAANGLTKIITWLKDMKVTIGDIDISAWDVLTTGIFDLFDIISEGLTNLNNLPYADLANNLSTTETNLNAFFFGLGNNPFAGSPVDPTIPTVPPGGGFNQLPTPSPFQFHF